MLARVEETATWPQAVAEAFVAMVPKSSGGSRPQDLRPFRVLDLVSCIWAKGVERSWAAVLQGQLPGTANATAARPETPPLARDWASTGSGQGLGSVLSGAGSGGSRAGPAQGSAGPAPSFAPLVWLSQGLAFVREHRMSLLAGVGGLVLLMLLQQVRGRRRA